MGVHGRDSRRELYRVGGRPVVTRGNPMNDIRSEIRQDNTDEPFECSGIGIALIVALAVLIYLFHVYMKGLR